MTQKLRSITEKNWKEHRKNMAEQTQVEILLKLRDEVTSGLGKIDNSIKGLDTTTSKLKA